MKSRFLLGSAVSETACSACPQHRSDLQEAQHTLADVYNMSPYKITWKGQREFLLMPFLSCVAVGFQHVWSESEDCLPFLQLAQDYISSCGKKTLHEILEKVFKSFRPVSAFFFLLLNIDKLPMTFNRIALDGARWFFFCRDFHLQSAVCAQGC